MVCFTVLSQHVHHGFLARCFTPVQIRNIRFVLGEQYAVHIYTTIRGWCDTRAITQAGHLALLESPAMWSGDRSLGRKDESKTVYAGALHHAVRSVEQR